MAVRSDAALLLRLDAARLRGSVLRPTPGPWIGIVLPLLLLAVGMGAAGLHLRPRLEDVEDAVGLGLLVSGVVASAAYPVLFRPVDDAFLRRLGLAPAALFAHRALRVFALSAAVALFFLLPFATAGAPLAHPLSVGAAAALAAWGAALPALSAAARSVVGEGRPGIASRAMLGDAELVRASPLIWAPLAPLLAGAVAAGVVGAAPGAARLLGVAGASLAAALLAARPFARALPRFAPRAAEMAFEPPPAAGETVLVVRRGAWRLLPRAAAAARARDAAMVARRYRWAERLVWPVAVGGVVALVRWGDAPGVRAWVMAAGAVVLAAQGAALVALGRGERGRTRWLDRALGLGGGARLLGRWAAGAGLATWLALPLALAWGARAPGGIGWEWLGAALAASGAAAALSVAAAGR